MTTRRFRTTRILLTCGFFSAPGIGAAEPAGQSDLLIGIQVGACLAVEAAKDGGMIDAEQVDAIFVIIREQMHAGAGLVPADTALADSDIECQKIVAAVRGDRTGTPDTEE